MKALLLFVATSAALGSASAVAAPLSYEFDFFTSANSAPISFFYQTAVATAQGTIISGVKSSPDQAAIFPLAAQRRLTGAWLFTAMFSPTAVETWTAQTGVGFPNSPGVYLGQPALLTVQAMFVITNFPGTVNVTIQDVPEPGTLLLMLTGFAPFGLTRRAWLRHHCY